MEHANETLRIAIVEDDAGFRRGLQTLIDFTPGYSCVSAFYSVENALHALDAGAADVMLVDINLQGGMSGSEGVRLLREKSPATHFLMLTSLAEEEKVFQSICNSACGYMLKKSPPTCSSGPSARRTTAARGCRPRSRARSSRTSSGSPPRRPQRVMAS